MKRTTILFISITLLLTSISTIRAQEPTPTPQCMTSTETPTLAPTTTETPTAVPVVTTIPLQTTMDFYRNPMYPGLSCITSATWGFPGSALTASTRRFYGDKMHGRQVDMALWLVAWTPNTGGGLRLVKFDNGPMNIEEIARIEASGATPVTGGVDITAALQSILDAGQFKQLGQQTHGNGSSACTVYASWIEIIWK